MPSADEASRSRPSTATGLLSRARRSPSEKKEYSKGTEQSKRTLGIRVIQSVCRARPSRATMALTAAFFQQFLCWGMLMTFGAVFTYYANHLLAHKSTMKLCLIGSVPPFLALAFSILWGRLLDSGYHLPANAIGGLSTTAGLVALMYTGGDGGYGSGSYVGVLAASFPMGLGQSCYFVTFSHVAKTWFPQCRGLAIGIAASGAAVGGSLMPLIFKFWTSHSGFEAGIGVLAALNGSLSLFITSYAQPGPTFQPRPLTRCSRLDTWIPRSAFRSRSYCCHVVAMCLVYSSILNVPFFLERWAQVNGIGISDDDADSGADVLKLTGDDDVYLVSTFNAFQFMGRLCGSLLTDSIPARRLHAISNLTSSLLLALFWFSPSNYAIAMLFSGSIGQSTGLQVSLPVNDIQDLLSRGRRRRRSSRSRSCSRSRSLGRGSIHDGGGDGGCGGFEHLFGQYTGMTYLFASPFILAGPLVVGWLVDFVTERALTAAAAGGGGGGTGGNTPDANAADATAAAAAAIGMNIVGYWAITGFSLSAVFLALSLWVDDVWKIDGDLREGRGGGRLDCEGEGDDDGDGEPGDGQGGQDGQDGQDGDGQCV